MIQEQLAEYYGLISHLDAEVGRILDGLAESNHADNTYVIYAADHGLAVGSHGLLGKQSVYEHSQQSPLIIVGPDVPHGETTALTYLFDLVPTISRLTNTPPLDAIDGHDLSSLWQGTQESIRDSLFLAYRDVARAVRSFGTLRLIIRNCSIYKPIRMNSITWLTTKSTQSASTTSRPY